METNMKKLLTLTFVIAALIIGAIGVQAQPYRYKKIKAVKHNKYKKKNNNFGNYNRRFVHTYYSTKYVMRFGKMFKKTYKIKVLRNGREIVNLVRVNRVKPRVFYRTKIVRKGWKTYRVTYKIKRFPNGRVKKKIVNKVRIHKRYYW